MAVPKRKTSKARVRSRRKSSAHKKPLPIASKCPECDEAKLPHRACINPGCGYYKGRQVLTIEAD